MSARAWMMAAGASGALAVGLGAFGAHGLTEWVSPDRMETWRTAASYHLMHSAMLAVVSVAVRIGWSARGAGLLFLAGIVLFSGSLYALVLLDIPFLGAIAPLGGLSFIAGWLMLARAAWNAPAA